MCPCVHVFCQYNSDSQDDQRPAQSRTSGLCENIDPTQRSSWGTRGRPHRLTPNNKWSPFTPVCTCGHICCYTCLYLCLYVFLPLFTPVVTAVYTCGHLLLHLFLPVFTPVVTAVATAVYTCLRCVRTCLSRPDVSRCVEGQDVDLVLQVLQKLVELLLAAAAAGEDLHLVRDSFGHPGLDVVQVDPLLLQEEEQGQTCPGPCSWS